MTHTYASQEKTDWTICGSLKERIETFKRTMPLIQDLKNPAMRERHWQQLRGEVQKPFDHNSMCVCVCVCLHLLCTLGPEFTLEKIIEIGLDQYSELIGEISGAASKELAIEQVSWHQGGGHRRLLGYPVCHLARLSKA